MEGINTIARADVASAVSTTTVDSFVLLNVAAMTQMRLVFKMVNTRSAAV